MGDTRDGDVNVNGPKMDGCIQLKKNAGESKEQKMMVGEVTVWLPWGEER